MFLPHLEDFKRIVIKVGSSLLVDSKRGEARRDWLHGLVDDLADLHGAGADILVVSSGAVALGRSVLGLPAGALRLEDSQAAASVGQIALSRIWAEAFAKRGIVAGQILVTWQDTEERRRYLNARETVSRLLGLRAAPVINENDTVATAEIRYGDNDRLAARVATMASADLLILLSDITGLFDAPPAKDPSAKLIPVVPRITAEIEAMAGGAASELSRGGMQTKIEAGKIATSGGAHMVIADGRQNNPVGRIAKGAPCTWFLTPSTPVKARKKWIAGSLAPQGVITIDDGAVHALASGASLLPAGVTAVDGDFSRGDSVIVRDAHGGEIGRGLVGYDIGMARKVIGLNSRHIASVLGVEGRTEMIHRDDLVLAGDPIE